MEHFTESDINALPVGRVQQSKLRAVLASLALAKKKSFREEKLKLTTYSGDTLEKKKLLVLFKVFFMSVISLITGVLGATKHTDYVVFLWFPLTVAYLFYYSVRRGDEYALLPKALFEEYSRVKKPPA